MAKRVYIRVSDGKTFANHRKARRPRNSFTNFFDKPATLGKKEKAPIKEREIKEVEVVSIGRNKLPNSRMPTTAPRYKETMVTIKVGKKKKKVRGIRIKVKGDSTSRDPKNDQNLGYVKKRHFGRFTTNPKTKGRGVAIVEMPEVQNFEYRTDPAITNEVQRKIGESK
jgi:hypothetical protein